MAGRAVHSWVGSYECTVSHGNVVLPQYLTGMLVLQILIARGVPLQLDEPEQADAELLALAAHTDASLALCLEGLSAVIALPCCGALKPAADLILERFGQDATVPLRIGELILCADAQVCDLPSSPSPPCLP